ncbi:MAG: YcaO-like family protein [Halanaerobiales bacterium]|nr:YcaO-like family protein [Halanaerobiales bacterium]
MKTLYDDVSNNLKTVNFIETDFRVCTPDETLKNVKNLIGEGRIICKVLRTDPVDCLGLPVYISFSKKVDEDSPEYSMPHAGKGVTLEQAKCSAIFEAIERYSAKVQRNEKLIVSSFNRLTHAIRPLDFILPEDWNITDDSILEWVEGYSLTKNSKVLVPANFVYFPYRPIDTDIKKILPHDTNGLAAGNSLYEAILHAIYEVVEKDAISILWKTKSVAPTLKLDNIQNKYLLKVLTQLEDKNVKVNIKDMTTDIRIPSVMVVLDCCKIAGPAFSYGSGTHLDPEVALLRAIVEAAQLRVTQITQNRYYPDRVRDSKLPLFQLIYEKSVDLIQHIITDNKNYTNISKISYNGEKDLAINLTECIKLVDDVGYEIVYVDITREEVNIPAVRVLIPGLEPTIGISSRTGLRVEQIPQKCGWTKL